MKGKPRPYLLEDMVYLTVLDVGSHMPPRIEIPEIVSMRDADLEEALSEAEQARREATRILTVFLKEQHGDDGGGEQEVEAEQSHLEQAVQQSIAREKAVQAWAEPRHLAHHYSRLVRALDDLARRRNIAARLAKGAVPRWFAALPCDRPFEVWETRRDGWGDTQGRRKLVETEQLCWEHLYPLERRLIALVQQELNEGRRLMLYFDQNELRSMSRRLEWVLKEVQPWTLPNNVAAEDRQQAILRAVQQGHQVVVVPYRRVNEGLNLQSGIDTIVWVEMALNLFMLDQASRRAWRLGKREEVRIYYLAYANTAGHSKLRKLGQQSGAAAAFAGEPARGALIEHAGADKTTLARLSSLLEQDEEEEEEQAPVLLTGVHEVAEEQAALKAVFARRAEELRQALQHGRAWLGGIRDELAERLAALSTCSTASVSVWAERPYPLALPSSRECLATGRSEQRHDLVNSHPVVQAPVLSVTALPLLPAPQAVPTPAAIPVSEPQHVPVTVVGSRAEVVFGRQEHITLTRRRSRPRRVQNYREAPRRRQPVSERDIPSLVNDQAAGAEEQRTSVALPSLWDLLVAPTSEAVASTQTLVSLPSPGHAAVRQPQLWERETVLSHS